MFGHKINSIIEELLFRCIQILRYFIKMDINKEFAQETEEQHSQEDSSVSQKSCKKCKIVCKSSSQCENCSTMMIKCKLNPSSRCDAPVALVNSSTNLQMNAEFDVFNLRQLYQMSGHSLRSLRTSNKKSAISNHSNSSALVCKPNNKKIGGSFHSIKIQICNMPTLQEAHIEDENAIEMPATNDDKSFTKESVSGPENQNFTSHSSKSIDLDLSKIEDLSQDDIIVISSDDDDEKSLETGVSEIDIEVKSTHNSGDSINKTKTAKAICHSTKCTQIPAEANCLPANTQTQLCVKMHPPRLFQIPSSSSSSGHNGSITQPLTASIPNGHKQRQLELHRLRVQVLELKRKLLELKLKRERDEMKREQIAFERKQGTVISSFHDLNYERDV
ncbi:uncharacterized protein LOC101888773 [Musca domestica]|uniref:Uncharacterized protein LOC101888773 n=1 Tax=Musca domestica TaxID=7370 RepID=A0A9J7CVW4_MUSDO|nr:uncharacterized protein LOC101888773 [Musca domestica]